MFNGLLLIGSVVLLKNNKGYDYGFCQRDQ